MANGANAGNLSPFSAVGVIANTKMAEAGVGGHEWRVWLANFLAHAVVGIAAYVMFGGARLTSREVDSSAESTDVPLNGKQKITIAIVLAWIAGVVGFKLNVGLGAFAAAAVLILVQGADERTAVQRMPWGVIVMVSGVSLLLSLLEKTGGMELFTSLLARLAVPSTVNGTIAFITGLISSWSSTSGVVLPAFLPTVSSLVAKVGHSGG